MRNKLISKDPISSSTEVTLEELIVLRKIIINPTQIQKKSQEALTGRNIAKIRGRGIELDSTREYQPGDDVRHMAWRVTARSLQPQVKVYQEDRERMIWLAIDLSPSLFFGTRCMFKSVKMINQAVILGWNYLNKREKIGACIATPDNLFLYKPQAREREFLTILNSLAECSKLQPAFVAKNCLHDLLLNMQREVRSGNLIYVLSDFLHWNDINKKVISQLAERAQVKMIFVYDPFEAEPPPAYQYMVTDGEKTALFNMDMAKNRKAYQQQFQNKLNNLIDFSHKYSIHLETLCTQDLFQFAKEY